MIGDAELYERSLATLVRSWVYLASGSPGAEVVERGGATVACFVQSPDRDFLNNAVLAPRAADLEATLAAVEGAYAERGIERFAVWTHESEEREEVVSLLEERGYRYDNSTRTMAMAIGELVAADDSALDLRQTSLAEFWRVVLAPDPELSG